MMIDLGTKLFIGMTISSFFFLLGPSIGLALFGPELLLKKELKISTAAIVGIVLDIVITYCISYPHIDLLYNYPNIF
jgi:hypothetical protein